MPINQCSKINKKEPFNIKRLNEWLTIVVANSLIALYNIIDNI